MKEDALSAQELAQRGVHERRRAERSGASAAWHTATCILNQVIKTLKGE